MKKQNQFCTRNLVENDDNYMLTWTIRGDAPLKSNDVRGFEKFADLVRISVVKLQADGRDGELGEGTLHGTLVKKLGERQAESYSRWLKENKKERSVVNFNEWLKEEVRVRVETKEMMYGVEVAESRQNENLSISRGKHGHGDRGRSHSFYTGGAVGGSKETKPLCGFCEGNRGVWSCKRFRLWTLRKGGMLRNVDGYAFVVWIAFTKGGYALGPSHVMSIDVQKNTITDYTIPKWKQNSRRKSGR